MKIQVLKMGEPVIEGYKQAVCSENYINLMDISDNECKEILAQDVLDSFSYDKIEGCIVSLVGKLRLNGRLVIGGTDIRLFSRMIVSGLLNVQQGSEIANSCSSMSSLSIVEPIVKALGLRIESSTINGTHFEIKARRG